jgi:hypothetical protein
MANVPYTSFYLGPFAVYNSPSGILSPATNIPALGGTLHPGDYCDLSASEAAAWNVQYGANLYPGRYRFVQLSTNAVAADLAFGVPVGFGLGTTVAQAILSAAGSGYVIVATGSGTGTASISSSASGGTAVATANITLASGVITAVQLTYPGAGFTSVPTWSTSLAAVLSTGSGGVILSRQFASPNFVSSFDSTTADQISVPRGVALCAPTAAQITAGAWVVIQEQGIANVLVTTATATAAGSVATTVSTGTVTTTTAVTAPVAGFLGYTLDIAAAATITRVLLALPVQQG